MEAKKMDVVDVAKTIRGILKRSFPRTKFSVRTERYTGGSSINIKWLDGPTQRQVERLVNRFEGSRFDGMFDIKEYLPPIEWKGEMIDPSVDFIFCERGFSESEAHRLAQKTINKYAGLSGEYCLHRAYHKMSGYYIKASEELDHQSMVNHNVWFIQLVQRTHREEHGEY